MAPLLAPPMGMFSGVSESTGETISFSLNTTDFPDGSFATDLILSDAGAHSKGVNNDNAAQTFTKAMAEMGIVESKEFTVSGGSASSPEVQNAASGLISVGTELWLKHTGSDVLSKAIVGGVSESGGETSGTARTWDASWTTNIGNGTPVFTNGNRTVSATGGVYCCARATGSGFSAGKYYWEVPFTNRTGGATQAVGIIRSGETPGSSFVGQALDNGYSFNFYDGHLYNAGDKGLIGTAGLTSGTMMIAVDLTNLKIWFGYNGTWFNGDPSTNTGGYHISSGTYLPQCGSGYDTALTSCFDQSQLSYTIPSGFSVYGLALGPYTYTLSDLSPAQSSLPEKAFKIRTDTSKALMALAAGVTDEPLCKETALTLGTCTASQVVATGSSSLLPYLASGNLSRDLIITVGGVDYVVQPNGEVTETGSGPYTTTIPIPTQASAPTAAKIANRFTEAADINAAVYSTGPLVTVTSAELTLPSGAKRLAMKVRGEFGKARNLKIYTKEQ